MQKLKEKREIVSFNVSSKVIKSLRNKKATNNINLSKLVNNFLKRMDKKFK